MYILTLEDRGSVSYYLIEALREEGHVVFDAYSVADAISYWQDENIECIIADLNLNPEGLNEDEISKTKAGLLTGWVWLKEYVFKKNEMMKRKTIIYSEYLSSLLNYVNGNELIGIKTISKRSSTSPVSELLKAVEEIKEMK